MSGHYWTFKIWCSWLQHLQFPLRRSLVGTVQRWRGVCRGVEVSWDKIFPLLCCLCGRRAWGKETRTTRLVLACWVCTLSIRSRCLRLQFLVCMMGHHFINMFMVKVLMTLSHTLPTTRLPTRPVTCLIRTFSKAFQLTKRKLIRSLSLALARLWDFSISRIGYHGHAKFPVGIDVFSEKSLKMLFHFPTTVMFFMSVVPVTSWLIIFWGCVC